jgi:alkylated DNA repair protein alkB family protein 7
MNLFRRVVKPSQFCGHNRRYLATSSCRADPAYVDLTHAPTTYDNSATVYPEFLTEEEGHVLVKEVSRRMKRKRFEDGHWDSVISKYREIELTIPNEETNSRLFGAALDDESTIHPDFAQTILRTRNVLGSYVPHENAAVTWLPCHAIDLSKDGRLDAHVDSIKFSGGIVAGISLLSDSIMRLRPAKGEWTDDETTAEELDGHVDLYLPKLSLYCLHGMSRFNYSHELLPSDTVYQLYGKDVCVPRGRRLSIIFRDKREG